MHLDFDVLRGDGLRDELFAGGPRQLFEKQLSLLAFAVVGGLHKAVDKQVASQVREGHAPSREHRSIAGDDDLSHTQLLRECNGMHGATAAECHQCQLTRVMPAA